MRGLAGGIEPGAVDAARGGGQPVVGGLAVDEKPRSGREEVCRLRALAAPLFADDEEQADTRFAARAQALGRRDLRDENPFRVTGAASVQPAVLFPARKERRHAVEV